MITDLVIENLVLTQKTVLGFSPGFSVITGETGSGKSALLHAFRLLSGMKWDKNFLRRGAKQAHVTATFSLPFSLEPFGLPSQDPLIITRVGYADGRSKAFINQHPVSLATLKKIGAELMEIAGQGSKLPSDLHSYDHFCQIDLEPARALLRQEEELERLVADKQRLHTQFHRPTLEKEREKLEEVLSLDEDEETLYLQYQDLSTAQERLELLHALLEALPSLQPCLKKLSQLHQLDTAVQPQLEQLEQIDVELRDLSYDLSHYQDTLTVCPHKIDELNQKLRKIHQIKKTYGSLQEATIAHQQLEEQLEELDNMPLILQDLRQSLEENRRLQEECFTHISRTRREHQQAFEALILQELSSLNMASAAFEVKFPQKSRSGTGDEDVEFWMTPNPGEPLILAKEYLSGGEASRLLLALKTTLAKRENRAMIVFDEIDSNIGGTTAHTIGQKFRKLSESQQIIAITHFPQVACHADHHYRIVKHFEEARTVSKVSRLDSERIEDELLRMQGALPQEGDETT